MWILEVNNILVSCKSLLSVKLTGRLTHRERSWIWPLYRHLFQSHRSLEFVCSAFPPEEHSGCISVQILQHKEHALSSNQHRAFIRVLSMFRIRVYIHHIHILNKRKTGCHGNISQFPFTKLELKEKLNRHIQNKNDKLIKIKTYIY